MAVERLVLNFKAPPGASRCKCGAAGPVGAPDVESCPWCDGSELPAGAVRVTTSDGAPVDARVAAGDRIVRQSKAARRIARGRR